MFDRTYYDTEYQAGLSHEDSAHHALRHDYVLRHIPHDANDLLDVGCGDAVATNRLPQRGRVVGVDFSVVALSRAQTLAVCASLDALCFPDASFDLVLATEVLEHLTTPVLDHAVREMARVARKYCIISVPNRERLRFARVTCPMCTSSLHVWGHLQSYTPDRLATLIPGFKAVTIEEVGDVRIVFPDWLMNLRRFVGGEIRLPASRACPICGYVRDAAVARPQASRPSRLRQALSIVATKRPTWLIATYTREAD